jgi:hypothetical protein
MTIIEKHLLIDNSKLLQILRGTIKLFCHSLG